MSNFQRRILKIIRIEPELIACKYHISSISQLLDKTNTNIMTRIIADPDHPITSKLPINYRATNINRRYVTNKANTEAYKNGFVQKHLRYLRDGTGNLYLPRSLKDYITRLLTSSTNTQKTLSIKPRLTCQHCQKDFIGLKIHLRTNPICRLKEVSILTADYN